MIRIFPSQTNLTPTDPSARIAKKLPGGLWDLPTPGLFDHDDGTPIRVSCTFTWDKPRAEFLAEQWAARFSDVELGGPAYGDPGDEFVPGRYVAEGAVITSRGCPKVCDFCLVPKREGLIRELEVGDGWNILDNNLLACSEKHLDKVFNMLRRQRHSAKFSGGLDASLFRQDHIDRLLSIKINELWFAADSDSSLDALFSVGAMLTEAGIADPEKRRCYILFDPDRDTLNRADERARKVYKAGWNPFAMVRRDEDEQEKNPDKAWSDLARYWRLPAIYKAAEAR